MTTTNLFRTKSAAELEELKKAIDAELATRHANEYNGVNAIVDEIGNILNRSEHLVKDPDPDIKDLLIKWRETIITDISRI